MISWSPSCYGHVGGISSLSSSNGIASLSACQASCALLSTCLGVLWNSDDKKCKRYKTARAPGDSPNYTCDTKERTSWIERCEIGQHVISSGACVPTSVIGNVCPSPPTPSNSRKRAQMTLEQKINEGNPLCNQGWTACPTGAMGAFECVDTMNDLWSCGGCNYAGIGGTDCSSIAGSDSVSCQVGKCVVESCRNNWTKTSQGTCAFNHARKR